MYRRIELFELENKEELPELVNVLRRAASSCAVILSYEVGFEMVEEGYDACLLADFQTNTDCHGFAESKDYINMEYEMPACTKRACFSWYREDDA